MTVNPQNRLNCKKEKNITEKDRIKAICLNCCCGGYIEVIECTTNDCPIFYLRNDRNPYKQPRELSEEQKQAMDEYILKVGRKGRRGC